MITHFCQFTKRLTYDTMSPWRGWMGVWTHTPIHPHQGDEMNNYELINGRGLSVEWI